MRKKNKQDNEINQHTIPVILSNSVTSACIRCADARQRASSDLRCSTI
jgi:hypothetical protein